MKEFVQKLAAAVVAETQAPTRQGNELAPPGEVDPPRVAATPELLAEKLNGTKVATAAQMQALDNAQARYLAGLEYIYKHDRSAAKAHWLQQYEPVAAAVAAGKPAPDCVLRTREDIALDFETRRNCARDGLQRIAEEIHPTITAVREKAISVFQTKLDDLESTEKKAAKRYGVDHKPSLDARALQAIIALLKIQVGHKPSGFTYPPRELLAGLI
jgi:hypothetical protein